MIEDTQQDAQQRMQKSIETLKHELAKVRTGRAHPDLLSHVVVKYYGNEVPITQVASISISDPRTLLVAPWEKGMVDTVEKAIRDADLGLNPATSGQNIRVPLPVLTEERRRDMTKIVRNEGENARVAIRNIRRDANQQFKDLLKEKIISEDDVHRAEDRIQKLTDKFIAEIEKTISDKESDLMEI